MDATQLRFAILMMIISATMSACGKGCLKCNTSFNNCLLCDFVSNYVLNSQNTCSISTINNCQLMNPLGQCLQCIAGYYFDSISNACQIVPTSNSIANCQYYSGLNTCQTCSLGYYLSNSVCLSVSYNIAGCTAYASSNMCANCSAGYVLHPSGNRCVIISASSCLFYTNLSCNACASGYGLDYNYFVASIFDSSSVNNNLAVPFISSAVINGNSYSVLQTPCRPLTIANCAVYSSFTVCQQCNNNYYLDSSGATCTPFPNPAIPNCQTYSYYNSCSACTQGFFLVGPTQCQVVRPIVNCISYSQTSNANICTQCATGYYVNGNICVVRQKTIANCATYAAAQDLCSICPGSYVLTTDSLACLPSVPNCTSYQSSNISTTQLICQTCAVGYYHDTNTSNCTPGQITNCMSYQANTAGSCQTCINGYYLSQNVCVPQPQITSCLTYSGVVLGQCTTCDNTSFLATQSVGCGQIKQQIASCVTYASPTACQTCALGFYLFNGSCAQIAASRNCLALNSGGTCIQCQTGYLLNAGVCSLPIDFQTANCLQVQNNGFASTYVCNMCQTNSMPLNYINSYICQSNSVLGINSVANCVKYELVGPTYTCRECSSGNYVSDTNTCVSNITNIATKSLILNYPFTPTVLTGTLTMVTNISDYYMTVAAAYQKCNYVILTNTLGNACLSCKSGFYPSVNIGNQKTHINPAAANPSTFAPVLGFGYNTYSCQTVATPLYYPGATSTPPANCANYTITGNNIYCKSCVTGYTGQVSTINGTNYQFCNVQINNCNTSVTYGGFIFMYANNPNNYDPLMFLNCHSCYNANNIPVMFGTVAGDIAPFGLAQSNNVPNAEASLTSNTVQCLPITALSFNFTPSQWISQFVSNCGAAKFNVDVAKNFGSLNNYNSSSLVCMVCRSGFKPIMLNNIIVRCDPIAFCNTASTDQWFNYCAQCQTGYTWFFDITIQATDFSTCVPTSDPNCFSTMVANVSIPQAIAPYYVGLCSACKNGYTFNLDNVCEAISAPLCAASSFVKGKYIYNSVNVNYDIFNLYNKNGDGCHSCNTSYIALKQTTDLYVCTNSAYVQQGNFSQTTVYVQNCQYYGQNGASILCTQCMIGYIASSNGAYCVSQSTYPNCNQVNATGNKCALCITGYVLVNEFCESQNISWCQTYNSGFSYQSCATCVDGYMLVSNKCIVGKVSNCKVYTTNQTCSLCYNNYLLLNLINSVQACLLINPELNCQAVSTSIINTTQGLACTTCANGYAPTIDSTYFNPYVCQKIPIVQNCQVYDINVTPSQSSFTCTQCASQYYLNNNSCVTRQVSTTNCLTYSPVNDFCTQCSAGFYLSNNKNCQSYPQGIYGCINYNSQSNCVACDKNMYLLSNVCVTVTTLISNCAYYTDGQTCSACQFTYFLTNNTCVKSVAFHCATYIQIDRCASCNIGFGLQQNPQTGQVNCVFIPNANCNISQTVFPFLCIQCQPLFYNENGYCLSVQQPIQNCVLYNTPVTCSRCAPNFILSLDGTQCMNGLTAGVNPYTNCIDNQITLFPQCAVCSFGKKFVNNVCTSCANNTLTSGCMFCGGDTDQYCQICIAGYYMDNTGICHSNSSAPSGIQ